MRAVRILGVVVVMAVASLLAAGQAMAAPAVSRAPAVPAAAPVAAAPAAPAPTRVQGTPCGWLIRDGVVVYGPVPITHGRKGFVTPAGTFRVTFKKRDHVSTIYDAEMPYSVFFNGGIAFHQGSLKQKSHGCIHLSRAAAKTFFNTLGRGAVVQVV
jgi:uncharacterized membrane protein